MTVPAFDPQRPDLADVISAHVHAGRIPDRSGSDRGL
jgi:hypothetical protein